MFIYVVDSDGLPDDYDPDCQTIFFTEDGRYKFDIWPEPGDNDNDGVPDVDDAFSLDGTETTDSDTDGIGDNAHTDDIGLTDAQEAN